MGFLGKTIKTGIAMKALEIAKREASKPQNQAKVRELIAKARGRSSGRTTR